MEFENRNNIYDFHTCKFCTYRSSSVFVMSKHLEQHRSKLKTDTFRCELNTPELHSCYQCEFETLMKVNLHNHIRVFHKEKDTKFDLRRILECYQCGKCDVQTFSLLILMKHSRNCKPKKPKWFECEQCGCQTKSKFSLKRHVLVKHTDGANAKWYKCDHCYYQTLIKSNWKIHITAKHNNINQKWLECKECTFKTKLAGSLKRHKREQHSDSKNRFHCDHCLFETTRKYRLTRHVWNIHQRKKVHWFECEHCTFKCKHEEGLKLHLANGHPTNEREWFKCELCRYRTLKKPYLHMHVLHAHSGYSKFMSLFCEYCPFKAKSHNSLKVHTSNVHLNLDSYIVKLGQSKT